MLAGTIMILQAKSKEERYEHAEDIYNSNSSLILPAKRSERLSIAY